MHTGNPISDEPESEGQVDIAFFFCPYTGHPPPHRFDINHGPAYIAAYLKQHGIHCSFYYGRYDNDPSFERIMAYLERVCPRSIGFTVYGSNLPETVCLCAAIKKRYPDIPIIWGGPQVRFDPKTPLETHKGLVDICVSGEGELPLKMLLKIGGPWDEPTLEKIPGITWVSKKRGDIISHPIGQTLVMEEGSALDQKKALDIYPSPFLEGMIPDAYFYDKSVVSIFTSRGCPHQCIYCQFSSLTNHKVLFHSVDRVLAEIKWIHAKVKKYHPYKKEIMIMIFDEALTLSRKRIETLCRTLISQTFDPPLRLWVETRADYVDEELLALLKEAGAKKINFGLESAVPKVLKKIRKVSINSRRPLEEVEAEKRFLNKIRKAVRISKSLGLYTTVSIIVGLPEETLADARETLAFVQDLNVDMYYHNFLNVLEGTQLAEEAADHGYDWQRSPAGYMGKYGHRFTRAPINTRVLMPLPNARVFITDKARFKFLLRGYIKPSPGRESRAPKAAPLPYAPFVLDLTKSDMKPAFIKALFSEMAGLSTTVFCPGGLDDALPGFLALFHTLPLKNGRLYLIRNEADAEARIHGLEEADQSTPYLFPFKFRHDFKEKKNGRSLFLIINDKADFDAFVQISESYLETIEADREKPGVDELPFELFESCRFYCEKNEGCPAASLTHVYVDGQNGLRPCRYFPAMTGPGEVVDLEKIRDRTRKHIEEVLRKRGCKGCDVKRFCPRCVVPFPLSEEEYCDFQKKQVVAELI